MLPQEVLSALSDKRFERPEANRVDEALTRLDVSVSPTFREFYSRYEGTFGSNVTGFELLDLCASEPSVVTSTELCRAEHNIPHKALVLTDLLGGAVLMYEGDTDRVYNVDFEGGDQDFAAGRLEPMWKSFSEFLKWYFGS